MSYLREDPEADLEFTASEEEDEEDLGVEQFRLENIKDRPPIYEPEAIHDVLEDIAWARDGDWLEMQVLTSGEPTAVDDCNDDIQRELAFYNQALEASQEAVRKFDGLGVPWMRPPDYYAENVKSDGHMAKVKEQYMYEQRLIEEAEQRRKDREAKRYAKQVQAEKQKERIREKKSQIEEITKLRKQRKNSGFEGDLEFDKEFKIKNRITPDKAGQRIRKDNKVVNKARQAKNARYGLGGRKKLMKQNTAESAANFDVPRAKRGGVTKRGGKGGAGRRGGKGGDKGDKKRMGKAARDAAKGRSGQRKR